jgi:hypothetical protein
MDTRQFTNPSHPMAASVDRNSSLSQFLNVFPPRSFLDSPGAEPPVLTFPASLDLDISGDTRHSRQAANRKAPCK